MRGKQLELAGAPCSIARALSQLSDAWTLLVIRQAFWGAKRFDEFHGQLGIASNVLSRVLRNLTDSGIFEKSEYQQHPPRYEYLLTAKGRDLLPILIGLRAWGEKHLTGKPEQKTFIHAACGHVGAPDYACPGCGEYIDGNVYPIATKSAPVEQARIRREIRSRRRSSTTT